MSDDDIRTAVDDAEEFDPNTQMARSSVSGQLTTGSDVEIAGCVITDLTDSLGELVFCDGAFWYFEKTCWRSILTHRLELAVQSYDGMFVNSLTGKPSVVKLNKPRVHSIIECMAPKLTRPDFFKTAPVGINCASGFISFAQDGTPYLRSHHPDHRCRHVLDAEWKEAWTDSELELSIMFSLLRGLVYGVFEGDSDASQKMALLQEIAGCAALGHATNLRQPKAIILLGRTAENGKSQILDLFRSLLPPDAIAAVPPAKMGDQTFMPHLIGKTLNATDELSSANAVASDAFKSVITGEPVIARDVYKSAVTFRPVAQHVFATNALPTFSGGIDRGVQRRVMILTFNRVIPKEERIEHIGRRIGEEEADLLLAWAVAGAARLIRQRAFTNPPSSEDALREWFLTADPVLAWARVRAVTPDRKSEDWSRAKIKRNTAYADFRNFAVREHYPEKTLPSPNTFVQRLRANFPSIEPKHLNDGNWLLGLELLPDPDGDRSLDPAPFGVNAG